MLINTILIDQLKKIDKGYNIINNITDSVISFGTNYIKSRYGQEIYISNERNDTAYYKAIEWIKKYDKKFNKRPKNNFDCLTDVKYIIKLDDNTYCDISSGNYINPINNYNKPNVHELNIYIFGKKYKKYIDELSISISRGNSNNIYLYNIKGHIQNNKDNDSVGVDSIGSILQRRDIDSLFYNNNTKEIILSHINNFINNKYIYEDKSLTYKTGILLYGVPGTGKTSLAKALASYYNYNLIVLDLGTFKNLDINLLTECINSDEGKFIILLEDIDTLFPSLDRNDNLDETTRSVINKMLQFLDSSSSPNDVIFIATTNDINKLDKAILRDGRFDIKVEIGNINDETAAEMLKSFNIPKNDASIIISNMNRDEKGLINPAELQNKALLYFKKSL